MSPFANMGSHLKKKYGAAYVNIGFVFGEGSFQAIGMSDQSGLKEWTLGPAPEIDVSTAFSRTGKDLLALDLRTLPKGAVRDWFSSPHPMRETGAVFSTEANMSQPMTLTKRFDAVIFIAKTTRARPVKN